MPWPKAIDYNEAVQNLRLATEDEELQAGEAERNARRRLAVWSGGFADVYKINCPATGNTWALKCFTKGDPGLLQERYGFISRYLEAARLPFTVDFKFLPRGIRIQSEWFPAVKMRWVQGVRLNEFVETHLGQGKMLRQLLGLWVKLAARLREARMAHADLQHGNVLLVPEGEALRLTLIDYDGMYVPELAGHRSGELGHPSFQHPQRLRDGTYNADVDRFSHLVICSAIRCLSDGQKDLWPRFNNGENLLFRESDFARPAESELFRFLWESEDRDARALVGRLVLACHQPLEQAPLVDDVIADGKILSLSPADEIGVCRALGLPEVVAAPVPPPAPGVLEPLRPLQPAAKANLVRLAGALSKLRGFCTQIEELTREGLVSKLPQAIQMLDAAEFLLQGIPETARGSGIPREQVEEVADAVNLLRTLFGQVRENIDGNKPANFAAVAAEIVAAEIDQKIARLAEIAPSAKPAGKAKVPEWVKRLFHRPSLPPASAIAKNLLRWTMLPPYWVIRAIDRGLSALAGEGNAILHNFLRVCVCIACAGAVVGAALLVSRLEKEVASLDVPRGEAAEKRPPEPPPPEPPPPQAIASRGTPLSPAAPLDKELTIHLGGGVTMQFVLIAPGEFMMGSPDFDRAAKADERPQHVVRITKPFYLGKYEVTQAQWQAVMGNNPSRFTDNPQRAVEQVSWEDAIKFCSRLTEKDGNAYRLPTEAEGEYACRAGTTTKWSFGDSERQLGDCAWYGDERDPAAHPVGAKKPNAWGLYDMHGNVWEWCADRYGGNYYGSSPPDDPEGTFSGAYRVLRGGSFSSSATTTGSASRGRANPADEAQNFGFRVAMVRAALPAPRLALLPIADKKVAAGDPLTVSVTPENADFWTGKLRFSLGEESPSGASVDPATGVVTWTPDEGGVYLVAVNAASSGPVSKQARAVFSVRVDPRPKPPMPAIGATLHKEVTVDPALFEESILHYTFDTDEGSRVTDTSGKGNHGVAHGPTYVVTHAGRRGVYLFDGKDDYIDIGNKAKPPLPITVCAWVCTPDGGGGHLIRNDMVDSGSSRHGILVAAGQGVGGSIYSGFSAPSTRKGCSSQGTKMSPDTWHHVAVVFHSNMEVQLFADGVEQPSKYDDGAGEELTYSRDAPGAIGCVVQTGERSFFRGYVDDVMICTRALSSDEIKRLFEATGPGTELRSVAAKPESPAPAPITHPDARTSAMRTWTSAVGNREIEAAYVSFEGGKVTLRKVDGTEISLELAMLSKEDQQHVRSLQAPPTAPAGRELTVDLGGGVRMQFVLIPAGEFMMGSPENEEGRDSDEQRHRVRIAQPFYLGAHEVTVGQFWAFVAATDYRTEAEKSGNGGFAMDWTIRKIVNKPEWTWRSPRYTQNDDHPVVHVSWSDAVAFCEWLSAKESTTYRLPTEAEWEYGCRAGTSTRFCSGNDAEGLVRVGNVADATAKAEFSDWPRTLLGSDGYVFTAPVARFQPNAFGLHDTHGNVCEWCADWYGEDYYRASPATDPSGPDSGDVRVFRGGSWGNDASFARSASRITLDPVVRNSDAIGFRVVRVRAEAPRGRKLSLRPIPEASKRSETAVPEKPDSEFQEWHDEYKGLGTTQERQRYLELMKESMPPRKFEQFRKILEDAPTP
jgi:formylglycine-generating enzyme required for sulfatase activity